jgi:hypothetical protein
VAGGTAIALVVALDRLLPNAGGRATDLTQSLVLQFTAASDLRRLVAVFIESVPLAVLDGVIKLLLLVFLRALLRNERLAAAAFIAAVASMGASPIGGHDYGSWWTLGVPVAVVSLLLLRQGLLAFVAASFVRGAIDSVPLTTHSEMWYADAGYAVIVAIAIIATSAFAATTRS